MSPKRSSYPLYPLPNTWELTWGIRYLLFQQVFLPWLLSLGLGLLGLQVTDAEFNFCYYIVNFLAVLWIFRRFLKDSLLRCIERFDRFAMGTAGGFIIYWVLSYLLSAVIRWALPGFFNVNDAAIATEAQSQFLLTFIGTVLLVPLAEECLFRGLLFSLFRRRSRFLGYLVSTLLFCAVHVTGYVGLYDWWVLGVCFLQYIPAGVALAWAFDASGSIFAPIVIHTLVNLTATLSMR